MAHNEFQNRSSIQQNASMLTCGVSVNPLRRRQGLEEKNIERALESLRNASARGQNFFFFCVLTFHHAVLAKCSLQFQLPTRPRPEIFDREPSQKSNLDFGASPTCCVLDDVETPLAGRVKLKIWKWGRGDARSSSNFQRARGRKFSTGSQSLGALGAAARRLELGVHCNELVGGTLPAGGKEIRKKGEKGRQNSMKLRLKTRTHHCREAARGTLIHRLGDVGAAARRLRIGLEEEGAEVSRYRSRDGDTSSRGEIWMLKRVGSSSGGGDGGGAEARSAARCPFTEFTSESGCDAKG
ncbi:hypothetical protein DFH06DRAFT_1117962 [Mycena polygramma]|nr:hypothetical protein DFH06DRAFT_1117962 [Mycena polygramma]